jgi:diketogulonate reductase-like aldo/keto reductase
MERFIVGTYELSGAALVTALTDAFNTHDTLYRVDTAQAYKNEADVVATLSQIASIENANANANAKHRRRDVEITSKIRKQTSAQGIYTRAKTITSASNGAIKCILLHHVMSPASWRGLERARDEGLVEHIGVSNYGLADLVRLMAYARTKPCANQIELHPFVPNILDSVEYCHAHNIEVQAHSILAKGRFFNTPQIRDIAQKLDKTPAQIMLRWAYQHGATLVVSAHAQTHIDEWTSVPHFVLSAHDMSTLDALSTHAPCRFYGMFGYHGDFSLFLEADGFFTHTELVSFARYAAKQLRIDEDAVTPTTVASAMSAAGNTVSEICLSVPLLRNKRLRCSTLAHLVAAQWADDGEDDGEDSCADINHQRRVALYNSLVKQLRAKVHAQRNATIRVRRVTQVD